MAKGLGIEVIAAATLPMEIEETRREQASIGLIELQGTGAKVFVHDLAKNAEFDTAPISDIFERSTSALVESVKNALVVINE